jgi:hypothetical protein
MPLTIAAWVVKTPTIEAVWNRLPEFTPDDLLITVTSGLRDAFVQLRIISGFAVQHHVIQPEFDSRDVIGKVKIDDMLLFKWQRTWSKLLVVEPIPIIVNPPYDAGCTEHYINSMGQDMYMKLIHQTPHYTGKCFDIGAAEDMDRKIKVIEDAKAAGVPIKGYRIERGQNCLHVDCL